MLSPDSTWPPGELTKTVMSSSDSEASSCSLVQNSRATFWLISPYSMMVRDLRSSSSSLFRESFSSFLSLLIVETRDVRRAWPGDWVQAAPV